MELKKINFVKSIYWNIRTVKKLKPKIIIGRNTIVRINKNSNIKINKKLLLGVEFSNKQKTLLNVAENSLLEVGNAKICNGCRVSLSPNATIKIGENVFINENTRIMAEKNIEIGDGSIIAWNVNILDSDRHDIYYDEIKQKKCKEIKIGKNVWIGFNSSILKGVTIGDGAVIASNTVVIKDVPSNTLVAGIPAKVINENVSWTG